MSDAQREARRRYNASEKGRAARARYAATPKGRAAQKKAKAAYNRANRETIRIASRRRKMEQTAQINALKVAAGCTDCGYNAHPAALEFDHILGGKQANVSALIGYTWVRIQAEIAKCEVVCANCHRIRTVERLR